MKLTIDSIPKELLEQAARDSFARGPIFREFERIRQARNRGDRVLLPFLNDRPFQVAEGGPILSGYSTVILSKKVICK